MRKLVFMYLNHELFHKFSLTHAKFDFKEHPCFTLLLSALALSLRAASALQLGGQLQQLMLSSITSRRPLESRFAML